MAPVTDVRATPAAYKLSRARCRYMSDDDIEKAVETFLDDAETVYAEYDQGYMDADAALSRLESAIAELEDASEL